MPRQETWLYVPGRSEFVCPCGVGHYACWAPHGVHGCCASGCCTTDGFPGRKPRVGDLALCGAGTLGLITTAEKVRVTYPDQKQATAWAGVHLTSATTPVGSQWSSRNPCIVSHVNRLGLTLLSDEQIQEVVADILTGQALGAARVERWRIHPAARLTTSEAAMVRYEAIRSVRHGW